MTADDTPPEQRALDLVVEAGAHLKQARSLLLTRASRAVVAGVDPKAVARAAGIDPATLRRWLTARDPGRLSLHHAYEALEHARRVRFP